MLYWATKAVVGPVLLALFRPTAEGAENVPDRGGALLASNHLSFSDHLFLPLALRRRITFVAKAEYFTGTGVKGRATAAFFRGVGQVPIDRSGGSASWAAMATGLEILRRGELFGIYPEGTRSPDGRLHRGKTGAARLALQAGVPIIPVAMIGTDKAQPAGQVIPTITKVGVRIGEPMDLSGYAGQEEDHVVLREITDELMRRIESLSGQEYVDEYAADRKRLLAERAERMLTAARAQADAAAAKAKAEAATATARARAEAVSAAARARSQADEYAERARTEYAAALERAGEATQRARDEAAAATGRIQAQVADATERTRAQADEAIARAKAQAAGAGVKAGELRDRALKRAATADDPTAHEVQEPANRASSDAEDS